MKPFDLEKAKAGAPLVTRSGIPVKFIAHVPEASEAHKVICLSGCSVFHFYENGVSFQYSESPSDLFLADLPKVKKSGWINIYHSGLTSRVLTEEEAKESAKLSSRVACVQIHWEEEFV